MFLLFRKSNWFHCLTSNRLTIPEQTRSHSGYRVNSVPSVWRFAVLPPCSAAELSLQQGTRGMTPGARVL